MSDTSLAHQYATLMLGLPISEEVSPDLHRLCRELLSGEREADTLKAENLKLKQALEAKQAHIDRLMLEFCPDEMTPEQLEEWAKHQVAVDIALGSKT